MKTIAFNIDSISTQSLSGAAYKGQSSNGLPCIIMPDANVSVVQLRIPLPDDWNGSTVKIQTIYGADSNTGDFRYSVKGASYSFDNGTPQPFSTSGAILQQPVQVAAITNNIIEIPFNFIPPQQIPTILNVVSRRVGTSIQDTSTSEMHVFGYVVYYD